MCQLLFFFRIDGDRRARFQTTSAVKVRGRSAANRRRREHGNGVDSFVRVLGFRVVVRVLALAIVLGLALGFVVFFVKADQSVMAEEKKELVIRAPSTEMLPKTSPQKSQIPTFANHTSE